MNERRQSNRRCRLALDLGPLVIFFAAFKFFGIFAATGVSWWRSLAALGIGYALERKLSPMPLFTAVIVLVFGGLTLYLKNDMFMKIKPTILYAFFGVCCWAGSRSTGSSSNMRSRKPSS